MKLSRAQERERYKELIRRGIVMPPRPLTKAQAAEMNRLGEKMQADLEARKGEKIPF